MAQGHGSGQISYSSRSIRPYSQRPIRPYSQYECWKRLTLFGFGPLPHREQNSSPLYLALLQRETRSAGGRESFFFAASRDENLGFSWELSRRRRRNEDARRRWGWCSALGAPASIMAHSAKRDILGSNAWCTRWEFSVLTEECTGWTTDNKTAIGRTFLCPPTLGDMSVSATFVRVGPRRTTW